MKEARRLRLAAQHLDARASIGVAELVRQLAAIQAQDAVAEVLAVRVRTEGTTGVDVERARVEERSVVRTWAMRGTLHLLPAADVRWILRLVGPIMVQKARRRHRELGLTPDVYARAVAVMRRALTEHGALTRQQIAARWASHGLPAQGQAVPHLLSRASMEGVICFGPTVRGATTHALLDSWLDDARSNVADPAAELARRYVSAYAPTTPEDYGKWSGLPAVIARGAFEALADDLLRIEVDGAPMWMSAAHARLLDESRPDAEAVKMLGAFDPYLLGYRVRDLGVGPDLLKHVHPGGGIIRPTILVDGQVIATWTRRRTGRKLAITVSPFKTLSDDDRVGIADEVEDIGRFLESEAAWDGIVR